MDIFKQAEDFADGTPVWGTIVFGFNLNPDILGGLLTKNEDGDVALAYPIGYVDPRDGAPLIQLSLIPWSEVRHIVFSSPIDVFLGIAHAQYADRLADDHDAMARAAMDAYFQDHPES